MRGKNTERQEQRVQEFERRSRNHVGGLYRHRELGWNYLPYHPFADEKKLLDAFGSRAEDCWGIDALWLVERDVHLLQVTAAHISSREFGLFARSANNETYLLNFVGIVEQRAIDRNLFEEVMTNIVASGVFTRLDSLGESLKRIGSL